MLLYKIINYVQLFTPHARRGKMQKATKAIRFDEDSFDLDEHKNAAKKAVDASMREQSRIKRRNRQIKFGKVMLAIATAVIIFALFFLASQHGLMVFR